MSTFSNKSKSSQSSFSLKGKDIDSWTDLLHSDIEAAGFDQQSFDDPNTGFDDAGNTIITSWTIKNKENG